MTKASIWQFNAVCSLILLASTVGIFLSWRDAAQLAQTTAYIESIPLVKKTEYGNPDKASSSTGTSYATSTEEIVIEETEGLPEEKEPVVLAALPKEINLDIPFTSQAPEKNWEQPWQDACEEAAVLMLGGYYTNLGISTTTAKNDIQNMVRWEEEKGWGGSIDIEKIKELSEEFIIRQLKINKYTIKIIEDPTVDQIKRYVAEGTPVYVVADGKELPNRHFNNGGPNYHALIIRGYTEDSFITNDPGTQFGKNFPYAYEDLMKSIRDWNGGKVKEGRRVVLVIE